MRFDKLALGVLVSAGMAACLPSYADTLTVTGTGGTVVNGVYVYPYNISVNHSSTSTPMMCLNYNDHVTVGETWNVTKSTVSTSSSQGVQEDAFLFSQLGKYSNSDVQYAVWYIMDPSDVSKDSGYDSTSKELVALATAGYAAGFSNNFLSQYTTYAPTSDHTGWTDGTPQTFMTSNVTPEPSSLLLLGTGLGAVSMMVLRRRSLLAE